MPFPSFSPDLRISSCFVFSSENAMGAFLFSFLELKDPRILIVGSLLRPAPTPDWNEIMAMILSLRHDRVTSILLRLAFQVTIYYIWHERNERRHTQKARPAQQLAKLIDKTIRQRILSTRYHEKRGLQGLLQCWFSAHFGYG
ncbi:hypothetical protein F2Q69_00037740 [Brassica cretica]|uniref:Reverse transcriptase zinc-binding domain-containing protein n=1 Tax=Brassica cretica TaxID=69181 RepID=A0A8S9STA3_BRACR|nr:hypothetical protein F2Q69_00037740 [Brassica cretica]